MEDRKKQNVILKRKKMLKRTNKKIGVAFLLVVIMLLGLTVKIFAINYNHGEEYSQIVLDHQTYTSTSIPYKRGQIVTSDGTVLAYSERVYNLILDVKKMLEDDGVNKESTINALVMCFDIDRAQIETVIANNPNSQYQRMLKGLTSDEIAEFNNMTAQPDSKIEGVWFEESFIRKYPFNELACDVIGFASAANGGELGLEKEYEDLLSGTDGVSYSYVGENLEIVETAKDSVDGNNIITTIDYNIQSIIEKHMAAYNSEKPSLNTGIVVSNPNNGEILAMASYPNFDLNNPRDISSLFSEEEISSMSDEDVKNSLYKLWANFCITESYEPGSTFKPFTIAAALEEGIAHDGDTYECKGFEQVADYKIKCHSYSSIGSHGLIDLEESLMNSCNPYMINLASKLGNVRFAQYIKLFGFGQTTGVDLPAEATGLTYDEDKITTIDAATNSFGQNINVNMVQLLSAYNSLINDGKYYQPHIVKRIENANGETVKNFTPTLVRQTVTASTSAYLRKYLLSTVAEGTAARANIQGYSIAGKTGTAQKGNRNDLKWVLSYIGHVPAEDPKFSIYIVLDEAYQTTGTGGSSNDALYLAKDIMTDLLPYMNIYKDSDEGYVDPANAPVEGGVDEIPDTIHN